MSMKISLENIRDDFKIVMNNISILGMIITTILNITLILNVTNIYPLSKASISSSLQGVIILNHPLRYS